MHFSTLLAALLSVALVEAKNFDVTVGANGILAFNPPFLSGVNSGDTVAFKFFPKNHTVTESTFAAPCTPKDNGTSSGFRPVAANATEQPQWTVTIPQNISAPFWFYCMQTGHCGKGMVFAINPTPQKTFQAFQSAANATGSSDSGYGSGSATPATATSSSTSASATSTSKSGAQGLKLGAGFTAGLLTLSGLVLGVSL